MHGFLLARKLISFSHLYRDENNPWPVSAAVTSCRLIDSLLRCASKVGVFHPLYIHIYIHTGLMPGSAKTLNPFLQTTRSRNLPPSGAQAAQRPSIHPRGFLTTVCWCLPSWEWVTSAGRSSSKAVYNKKVRQQSVYGIDMDSSVRACMDAEEPDDASTIGRPDLGQRHSLPGGEIHSIKSGG